jgi:hypothetical protein
MTFLNLQNQDLNNRASYCAPSRDAPVFSITAQTQKGNSQWGFGFLNSCRLWQSSTSFGACAVFNPRQSALMWIVILRFAVVSNNPQLRTISRITIADEFGFNCFDQAFDKSSAIGMPVAGFGGSFYHLNQTFRIGVAYCDEGATKFVNDLALNLAKVIETRHVVKERLYRLVHLHADCFFFPRHFAKRLSFANGALSAVGYCAAAFGSQWVAQLVGRVLSVSLDRENLMSFAIARQYLRRGEAA